MRTRNPPITAPMSRWARCGRPHYPSKKCSASRDTAAPSPCRKPTVSRIIARFSSRVVRSASSACQHASIATRVTTGAPEASGAGPTGSSAAFDRRGWPRTPPASRSRSRSSRPLKNSCFVSAQLLVRQYVARIIAFFRLAAVSPACRVAGSPTPTAAQFPHQFLLALNLHPDLQPINRQRRRQLVASVAQITASFSVVPAPWPPSPATAARCGAIRTGQVPVMVRELHPIHRRRSYRASVLRVAPVPTRKTSPSSGRAAMPGPPSCITQPLPAPWRRANRNAGLPSPHNALNRRPQVRYVAVRDEHHIGARQPFYRFAQPFRQKTSPATTG